MSLSEEISLRRDDLLSDKLIEMSGEMPPKESFVGGHLHYLSKCLGCEGGIVHLEYNMFYDN